MDSDSRVNILGERHQLQPGLKGLVPGLGHPDWHSPQLTKAAVSLFGHPAGWWLSCDQFLEKSRGHIRFGAGCFFSAITHDRTIKYVEPLYRERKGFLVIQLQVHRQVEISEDSLGPQTGLPVDSHSDSNTLASMLAAIGSVPGYFPTACWTLVIPQCCLEDGH